MNVQSKSKCAGAVATMPEYLVTWQMEIEASSPRQAAEKARQMHRNPESIATVFEVDGKSIDLMEADDWEDRGGRSVMTEKPGGTYEVGSETMRPVLAAAWSEIYRLQARSAVLTVCLLSREIIRQFPTAAVLELIASDAHEGRYYGGCILDAAGDEICDDADELDAPDDAASVAGMIQDLEYDGDWMAYATSNGSPAVKVDLIAASKVTVWA